MGNRLFSNIPGDLSGGISSAVMALPGNIIYGMIAFSPLGPDYVGQAILAGIYASVFAGFFATVSDGTHGMISGPRAPTTIAFASVIGQILATGFFADFQANLSVVITLGFATVLFSGIIQILFVLFRLDRLVKYLSFPVIAGVLNGTVIIITKGAICNYLGISEQPLSEIFAHLGQIKPLAFFIAFMSTVLWMKGNKIVPKIPGSVLSLLGGTALYYGLTALGFGGAMGGTIEGVPTALPTLKYFLDFFPVMADQTYWQFLPIILTGAFAIAILSSIESSLAVLTLQNLTNERRSARSELIAQGIGNIMNAIFGAIPAGGATSRVIVNYNAGGRTRLSGIVFSLLTLIIILLFSQYIGYIPKAVIAGMTLVVAYLVLDKWSVKLFKRFFSKDVKNRKELLVSMAVVLIVMFTMVYFNIIIAVAVGIALSIFLFVERMSKSIIRYVLGGARFHSKKQRYFKTMKFLETHGDKIAVIELGGAIFFGATDNLLDKVDRLLEKGVSYIVLDMKRVSTVDISGGRVLGQMYSLLKQKKVILTFSYLQPGWALWDSLKDLGLIQTIDPDHLFSETDLALEYCEDRLLQDAAVEQYCNKKCALHELLDLDKDERERLSELEAYLEKKEYRAGTRIFEEGDVGDGAFIITEGSVKVTIEIPETNRVKRLATLSFGTIFGEMALLESGTRSATVGAIEDTVCYKISLENFERMKIESPQLAMIIMKAFSKFLVGYLRRATVTMAELER